MTHICTSFVPRTIRIWSILPVDIACAPSTETFKSRLIEAIRTGAIVVAPPRTVDDNKTYCAVIVQGALLYVH